MTTAATTRATFLPFSRPSIGENEIREVVECLKSGWITTGPRTERFEKDFAAYVGAKHAIPLSSGTAALHCAYWALGLGGFLERLLGRGVKIGPLGAVAGRLRADGDCVVVSRVVRGRVPGRSGWVLVQDGHA